MPQTKTTQSKPAAAEAPQPEPRKPTALELLQLRHKEAQRQLDALQELIGEFTDMHFTKFEALKTFKLILDRDRGATTPVEDFITGLVMNYGTREQAGEGLTMRDVEHHYKQLVENDLEDEIRRAHLMASRYPLPEPADTASE